MWGVVEGQGAVARHLIRVPETLVKGSSLMFSGTTDPQTEGESQGKAMGPRLVSCFGAIVFNWEGH